MPLAGRLRDAAGDLHGEQVSVDHLLHVHGPAAQGSLLLMLAVPCLLPVPGAGTVLGWGMLAMALALWRGCGHAVLPRRVAELRMPRRWAQRVLGVLASVYELGARVARSRACPGLRPVPRWALAAMVAVMAVLIILPIPLGNILPAVALIVIGLGLAFRDEVLLVAGVAGAAATAALTTTVLALAAAWGWSWAQMA